MSRAIAVVVLVVASLVTAAAVVLSRVSFVQG